MLQWPRVFDKVFILGTKRGFVMSRKLHTLYHSLGTRFIVFYAVATAGLLTIQSTDTVGVPLVLHQYYRLSYTIEQLLVSTYEYGDSCTGSDFGLKLARSATLAGLRKQEVFIKV